MPCPLPPHPTIAHCGYYSHPTQTQGCFFGCFQVPEIPWLPVPSLKIDCEYVSFCHQTAAQVEDTDSNDYVNVACLTHLSSCAPGPRPWCQ